jgi:hypothetical protein
VCSSDLSGSDLITAYTNTTTSTATEATVEAIIAPHSATAGRVLTFTTSDKARTYELDSSLAFEAGKVYALDVTLKGIGEANCYIVAPNSTLTFPATRAYTSKTGTTLRVNNTTYIGEFAAAVMWSDAAVIDAVSVSGSGNSAKVTVNTTGVSGNAVVKIYKAADANQTPVWSFHIWVTDYDPTVNTWTNNGFTFMDRNLGATEAGLTAAARGLYYQWGRKDPFLGTGVPTVAVSAATGTVAYTIENPDKFITTKSTPFDWYYGSSRNNTLWGHNTTKSVYDPCPEGWRVPVNSGSTSSPWYGVSSQKFDEGTGVNWGTNALYPTTGYLWDDDGNLYFVGINGFYWTASASSVETALCLHLNLEGSFSTSYTYTRAHGFPVRCVQE